LEGGSVHGTQLRNVKDSASRVDTT